MTSAPAPAAPWLSLPTIAAIVVLVALAKLYLSAHAGLSFDESYYTFWSERLTIGYLDHPPAVAWLIAAGRALLGDNELGVRVFAVVCGGLTSALIWRIGVLLLDRQTAALGVLLYTVTPASGLGFLMTPDPPSALFWAAAVWAIAECCVSGRFRWWLVAGAFAGLGLWSKYTDAFLAPGLLLFVLTDHERRRWLLRWHVWAAVIVMVIVFSPVIWWNYQHDWASFRFQGQRSVTTGIDPNWAGNLLDLLGGQALYEAPVLVLLTLSGMLLFFLRPGDAARRGLALPVWSSVPALAYFIFHTLHAHVEANWLIPLWPGLSLVGAYAALALWRRGKWLAIPVIALQLLVGLALPALVYAQTLWQPFSANNIDRTLETRGWPKLQRDVAALAQANGARWIATSSNFGVAGELASYFLFAHSPLPVREIDEPMRWLFLPVDPEALGWPALYVHIEPNPAAPQPPSDFFGATKLVGVFQRDGGKVPLESWSAFVVSQPTAKFFAGIGR